MQFPLVRIRNSFFKVYKLERKKSYRFELMLSAYSFRN